MREMSLSEKITYLTVLIRCQYSDGTSGSGTGFIINICHNTENNTCIPILITNNHVVENSVKTIFDFCKADDKGEPIDTEKFAFTYEGNSWIHHPNSEIDLCCLPLGQALYELNKSKVRIFYIPLDESLIPSEESIKELSAMEDVVMVGYPIGLSDVYNHKPVIRRGITATHLKNDYQGKRHFLIDMACFPGSSGSPIFILNQGSYSVGNALYAGSRLFLVGVLFGGPQYSAQGILSFSNLPNVPHALTQIPTNLGIAIKAQEILRFEELFKKTEEINNG